ncbi:hypothetical protein [Neisseria elongata]|uniref:hypothetical protein n=1 Tax=Neisseria elongata TaxID=495 RepID=UPI000D317759|nr:hypothetical protein [Neisseria elongata]
MTSCLHAPIGKKQLDGYPNLSDCLKGRLKNTASENHAGQPPIGETDSPAPFPPNARIFRPISQQQSAYPAKLINTRQKHPTATFRANPKHCGCCGRFPCQSRNVAKPMFKPKHHSSPRPAKHDWPTFQTAPPL